MTRRSLDRPKFNFGSEYEACRSSASSTTWFRLFIAAILGGHRGECPEDRLIVEFARGKKHSIVLVLVLVLESKPRLYHRIVERRAIGIRGRGRERGRCYYP